MDKYKIDSDINIILEKSKIDCLKFWHLYFENKEKEKIFFPYFFENLNLTNLKEHHISYIKERITHVIKSCKEDIFFDE